MTDHNSKAKTAANKTTAPKSQPADPKATKASATSKTKAGKSNGTAKPNGTVKRSGAAKSKGTAKPKARKPKSARSNGTAKASKSNGTAKPTPTQTNSIKPANPDDVVSPKPDLAKVAKADTTNQDLPAKLIPVVEHVLHGKLDRTFPEVISEAGLTAEEGVLLWRVLGFDDSSAYGVVFNQHDVDAVKAFKRAVDRELLTPEDMYEIIRAIAQTTSRLTDWQNTIIGNRLRALGLDSCDPKATQEDYIEIVDSIRGLRPILERLLLQVWRRQSVDYILRSERLQSNDSEDGATATIAFADMVGFTRISRELDNDKLAKLIERFEQVVTLLAAESGAKLMKTLGDEVLIMSSFPVDVAEFALKLQDFVASVDDFPELRIGVATGTVITQMGDVFGETVNHASRLTAFAKPSAIYVDAHTHDELENDPRYKFKSTRMRAIQGFSLLPAWELKRGS